MCIHYPYIHDIVSRNLMCHLYFQVKCRVFSILCFLLLINAINFIDGLDGLASTIILITISAIFFLTFNHINFELKVIFLFAVVISAFIVVEPVMSRAPSALLSPPITPSKVTEPPPDTELMVSGDT